MRFSDFRKILATFEFSFEDGKVNKAWLHDIKLDEARMSALDKLKKFDRDRIGGAAWALWDTTTNDVELHREEYDAHPVIEMCEAYNPDIGYLVKVLVRR